MRSAITLSLAVTLALAAPAVLAAGVLAVSESDRYGRHLADAYGRALYLLEADGKGKSTCNDDCAQTWPPLRPPSGFPFAAGAAVRPHLIAIIGRRDGSPQVTYNGHPLYLYAGDRGSREASGQGLQDQWGRWYLVTPQGTKLQSRAQSDSVGAGRPEAPLGERFEEADLDANGSVSRDEFDSFIASVDGLD